MNTTPISLLERRQRPAEQEAWGRFVQLYTPLLFHWARRLVSQEQDAADLVQDVFLVLVRKLPEFTYNRDKSFRAWLRTVLLNQWRTGQRRPRLVAPGAGDLAEVADPDGADALAEEEYRQHLVARAMELMRTDFQESTWKACWEFVVLGRPAAEVAEELGITVKAVYLAKSRVLRRLRQELKELLD
jgi:RNA polymerase sigma-70 factor (ECF subfamily)